MKEIKRIPREKKSPQQSRESLERRIASQNAQDGRENNAQENYERSKRICEKSEAEKREGDRPR